MFLVCLDEGADISFLVCLAVIVKLLSGNIMNRELIKLMRLSGKTKKKKKYVWIEKKI